MPDQRKEYFNCQAPGWDAQLLPEKQDRILQACHQYVPPLAAPVLDVGCGTGVLIPVLLKILPGHSRIIELDIAGGMLRQARGKNKNNNRISHINADIHFLPLADCSVVTAICFESLPHFRDLPAALQELHRVLQSGGKLIILHLISHEKLNELHRQTGGAICRDYLPSLADLAGRLTDLRFRLVQAIEREDLYLVAAEKR